MESMRINPADAVADRCCMRQGWIYAGFSERPVADHELDARVVAAQL
jgi:hypothetical protein